MTTKLVFLYQLQAQHLSPSVRPSVYMAEIKCSLPKVVGTHRQRRGRRKTIAMAPTSLNGPIAGLEEKEVEAETLEWCKECMKRGSLNAVSFLQISDELAVVVCNDEQCTSLPILAPGSHLVVERRAADIIQCRKRKRRATNLQKLDPTIPESKPTSLSKLQGAPSATVSPLPPSGVVQWNNESNMCWLDVCMLLLVQFRSLRRCHQALGATSPLRKLCDGFDLAQGMAAAVVEAAKQASFQSKSNKSTSVEQLSDASDLEVLSAYLENDLLRATDSHNLVDSELLSDHFLDFIDEKLPNKNVCETSAQSADERRSGSVLTNKKDSLPAYSTSHKQLPRLHDTSTGKLAAAVESLRTIRKELFEMLKPKLGCQENKEESPISALPTLLRMDGATEEHFQMRYRREFYCFSCGFTNVTIHRNAIMSLTSTPDDFSMQNPMMHHPCPQCKVPSQTSRLIYHSLPSSPLVHFSKGLSGTKDLPWSQPNFRHRGHQYQLSCIIQYTRDPDHFIIWIRDPSREQWMKCDGLSSPVCLWQSQEPSIPPSEIHLVGWERQEGDCHACLELQQQMIRVEEESLEKEDEPAVGTASHAAMESSTGDAPLRKRSCPVVAGRSSSPVTTLNSTWPSTAQSTRNQSDIARMSSNPLKTSSLLSIGTPPNSPELEMPKTGTSSESKDGISADICSSGKDARKQQVASTRKNSKEDKWERAVSAAKSENQGHESNRRSVASYLLGKTKNSQKPSGVLTGLMGNVARSLTKRQQDTDEEDIALRGIYNPVSRNFSVLQTLRSLNINSTLPKKDIKDTNKGTEKEKRGPKVKPLMEKGGEITTSLPKQVQKIRLPRKKIDSFSAFREKSSNMFSGYLKQKEPVTEDFQKSKCSQSNASQLQEDDFQSSILLTPSSSVSSPSACSEASLQNENLPSGGGEEHEVENLNNTMDALCKALDVAAHVVPQSVAPPSHTSVDDDSFLQDLLR